MKGMTNANASVLDRGITTNKLADGAVTAAKIASGTVSRAKLAQDALYSPIRGTAANVASCAIKKNDIGKTLLFTWTSDEATIDTEFTLSLAESRTMPTGAEIALYFMRGKSCTIKFTGGLYVDLVGEAHTLDRTLRIPERYGIVALKKVNYDGVHDHWLATGNVEVVE